MAAHGWCRVRVTANNGDTGYVRIGTLVMRSVPGGANLCFGPIAQYWNTQFAVSGDNSASVAFDANPATAWAGSKTFAGGPAIGYHFAAAAEIVEVLITARADSFGPGGAPKDFTIESSDDGVTWTAEWSVVNETAWAQGETRTFARPVTSFSLAATLPVPIRVAGTLVTSRVVTASLPVPIGVAGALVTSRVLTASLPLPIRVAGVLSAARLLGALLPVQIGLTGRMVLRDRWTRTDGDPASNWTTPQYDRRVEIGLGPATALPYNTLTLNAAATYIGVGVSFDAVTRTPPLSLRTRVDSIQQYLGFGFPPAPFVVRFDRPVREFGATMQQMTFFGGAMVAYDANGVEVARMIADLTNFGLYGHNEVIDGGVNGVMPLWVDAGSNIIRSVQMISDQQDWVVWTDLHFTLSGIGAPWTEHDVAPATAWSMN